MGGDFCHEGRLKEVGYLIVLYTLEGVQGGVVNGGWGVWWTVKWKLNRKRRRRKKDSNGGGDPPNPL